MKLIKRIENAVGETGYHCSIGYSFREGGEKSVEEMLKESDAMMYDAKERYYAERGIVRRGADQSKQA